MKLIIARGKSKGKVFDIAEGINIIGRWDAETNSFPEIDLESEDDDTKISRRHAQIERGGLKIFVEDLGSLNGTFVNRSQRLEKGAKIELKNGDEVIIGKICMRFNSES